ncbi:hypothetical protein WI41_07555 [Burkholderia latens]|uniref:Uncharacterized protein n=1 Tax=Burkholderia latens TaxID=488446 RepID=A0AAP1C8W5_9BURK|nr:hypothetical protein [Burkholderia latens]KVA11930.1 hypothetical protein WI41_07555 [Burkholderia latens]
MNEYLKRMARLAGRKLAPKLAKKAAPLPAEVQNAIDGASFVERVPTEDGYRVVVSMVGLGRLVVQETPDIEERISRAWPELNKAQVGRVLRAIQAGASAAIARNALPTRPEKRWSTQWQDKHHPIKTERDF